MFLNQNFCCSTWETKVGIYSSWWTKESSWAYQDNCSYSRTKRFLEREFRKYSSHCSIQVYQLLCLWHVQKSVAKNVSKWGDYKLWEVSCWCCSWNHCYLALSADGHSTWQFTDLNIFVTSYAAANLVTLYGNFIIYTLEFFLFPQYASLFSWLIYIMGCLHIVCCFPCLINLS